MKNLKNKTFTASLLSLLLLIASCSGLNLRDNDLFRSPSQIDTGKVFKSCAVNLNIAARTYKPTNIEKIISDLPSLKPAEVELSVRIEELRKTNPDLAAKVEKTRRLKQSEGKKSIELNLDGLTSQMRNFVNGPYRNVVGARGVSDPFMEITPISDHTLLIYHKGEKYPLLIKWVDEFDEIQPVKEVFSDGKTYRMLVVPRTMKTADDFKLMEEKYINHLIAGSRLQKTNSSERSLEMSIASLLHDGKLFFDRKTQKEYFDFRTLLDSDISLRQKVMSLIFLGTTGIGKTRIISKTVISKINQMTKALLKGPQNKKLTVVMANSPSLANNLAISIGADLQRELGAGAYRILLWGGVDSESSMSRAALKKFIDESDVPVVLVTTGNVMIRRNKTDHELKEIISRASLVAVDETHNSESKSFNRITGVAKEVAREDRESGKILGSLDILGLTASPVTRYRRTSELYDYAFWGGIDSPGKLAWRIKKSTKKEISEKGRDVLEWIRMNTQFEVSADRGEINAPRRIFYDQSDYGHKFDSLFDRAKKGTHSSVNLDNLKTIWPDIEKMIKDRGPGIINAYARDADGIAATLSELSDRNFLSLRGLNPKERAKLYKAYINQTPYLKKGDSQAKVIDAIVGRIEEGHDFPRSGWYLSFKLNEMFPANLQMMGRIVRTAIDKLTPVAIYFGYEVDRTAYKEITDLILKKLGAVSNKIAKGNGFLHSRIPTKKYPESSLAQMMNDFNAGMESFFRINSDITLDLEHASKMDQELIKELQNNLLKMRRSNLNKEVADLFKKFAYEIQSFPFYKGNLKQTWAFCDKLIKAEKGSTKKLSKAELALMKNANMMEMVKEFRESRYWMGAITRNIIEGISFEPINSTEASLMVNRYIKRNSRAPYDMNIGGSGTTLKEKVEDIFLNFPESFWKNLDLNAKVVLDPLIRGKKDVLLEDALTSFISKHKRSPEYTFDTIKSPTRDLVDEVEHKLASRLHSFMNSGRLQYQKLDQTALEAIDSSEMLKQSVTAAGIGLRSLIQDLQKEFNMSAIEVIEKSGLSYEKVMNFDELGILKTVKELKDRGYDSSAEYYEIIQSILRPDRL